MKEISKQRKWQLRKKAAGNCQRCGQPSPEKSHCGKCAKSDGTKRRSMLRSEWAAVDWTLSNTEIARLLGRAEATARYQRDRRAAASGPEKPCSAWYPLFEYMSRNHGLTLLDDELNTIAFMADESRMRRSGKSSNDKVSGGADNPPAKNL